MMVDNSHPHSSEQASKRQEKEREERRLDEALFESFPASDATSIYIESPHSSADDRKSQAGSE